MPNRRSFCRALGGLPLFSLAGAPAFAAAEPSDADAALRASIESTRRSAAERARDADRHPYETLHFFGLKPDQTVIEIAPGGGWYTAIIAPILRDKGRYIAALYTEDEATPAETEAARVKLRARFDDKFGGDPARYGRIVVGSLLTSGLVDVGPPASADSVLTFRNIHNWIAGGHLDQAMQAFYDVLKPGGVLGVEEHRAPPSTTLERIIATGYVREDLVIARARAAGFDLAASSEINANPRDDHEHPNGVWSLPPTLRGGDVDRAKFLSIGESDRMTLKFVKPAR